MPIRKPLAALVALSILAVAILFSQSSAQPEAQQVGADFSQESWQAFGGIQPRLSPDGRNIVCSWQGAICKIPREGGRIERLTHQESFDHEPVWSGDGKRIAYIQSLNLRGGPVALISAEDGREIDIPKPVAVIGIGPYYKLEYHPTEEKLLGLFRQAGQNFGLAWYDLKTGEIERVVELSRGSRFALSQDGTQIAYTMTDDQSGEQTGNNGPEVRVYAAPSAGGDAIELGRFPARIYELCWAESDRSLIVSTDLGVVHNDLWRLPLKTDSAGQLAGQFNRAEKLTYGQADEDRPSVAADRWLLFSDNRAGSTSFTLRDLSTNRDQTVGVRTPSTDTSRLKLAITDERGEATTARVAVQRIEGKFHAPVDSLYRILGSTMHFYGRSTVEMSVPPGRSRIRAWRGPEYTPLTAVVELKAGENDVVELNLERWFDASAQGWHSGENHIHANYGYGEWYNTPATMLAQSAGEDIGVSNFMVANSDGNVVFDREFFRGRLDPLSTDETLLYWNQEFRSTIWGHMTLVNLQQIVEPVYTGFHKTTNPWDTPTNSDIADRAHWQNGLVNYTHVAQNPDDPYVNPYTGKGIPIDVALGKIDSLDLNASYAGTVPLWYRLLNCGFHLPASAGTDTFLNRINSRLPGGHRVYVQHEGPRDYHKWIEGLRAGRSFVTNGPMLSFSVNGKQIGDTLDLAGPGEVIIEASAQAQFPLGKLELIQNGNVIAEGNLSDDRLHSQIKQSILLNEGGWLGVRVAGPPHPESTSGDPYAHTSPIYVTMNGKQTVSADDARYFLEWIDRLDLAIRLRDRIPNEVLRQHVREQFDAARAIFSTLRD